jgi:hypothetical protein
MGVEWQSRDFLTDWTGLFVRRQSVDVPPSYARTARNVDFFGSAIGKRAGTQIVNGWGTTAVGNWTVSFGTASGNVIDGSGFRLGDSMLLIDPVAGAIVATGTLSGQVGNFLQLTSFSGALPVAGVTAVVTRRDLGGNINGLYHAVFRDGTEQLLAAVNGRILNVWASQVGTSGSYIAGTIPQRYPTVTIAAGWTATQGPLSSYETLVGVDGSTQFGGLGTSALAPDIIQIVHAGSVIYEGTIAHITGGGSPHITLTAAASSAPLAGDQVILFPHALPGAGDVRFTMFNNRVYVASIAARNPVGSGPGPVGNQRQPPTVIEQGSDGSVYQRRMGIRAPTHVSTPTNTGSTGILSGTYFYRWTYVNGLNGQESEGSPDATISGLANDQVLFPLFASPDPQVTGVNLYRSLSGQDGTWYLVPTVTVSGTVTPMPIPLPGGGGNITVVDNTPDDSLGPLLKTFSNEPPPDTITMFAVWTQAGALIAIDSGSIAEGGEDVAWSDAPDIVNGVYKLESWPINNTLFVNRDDGDKLIGLGVFYDSVVVWKGRSMHRIVGAPPDIILQPISFRDDHTGVGIWSAKGFIMDTDVAVFVSDDGFYQVSRYEGVQQGFTSSRISRAIDQEFLNRTSVGVSAVRANRERSHLLYHRVKRRLQAFVPLDGNAHAVDMFVYQFEGTVDGTPHGWSEWSVPIDYNPGMSGLTNYVTASCIVNSLNGPDVPHYGCGALGLVVRADTGAGEWQSLPVTFEYETVWFSASGAGMVTRGRSCDFVLVPTNGIPALQLLVGQDFAQLDTYQLPQISVLNQSVNLNALFLSLAQYHSLGVWEQSVSGLFLIQDFTFWFQRLPVGVTPRIVVPMVTGPPS